jgi:hypothetical protein
MTKSVGTTDEAVAGRESRMGGERSSPPSVVEILEDIRRSAMLAITEGQNAYSLGRLPPKLTLSGVWARKAREKLEALRSETMIRYYTNTIDGRQYGLVRHRSGPDGAGVEALVDGAWSGTDRSVSDLLDMDEITEEAARDLAIRYGGRLEPEPPATVPAETRTA